MSQYLVVLDRSNLAEPALREFERLNSNGSTFHVVVPARPLSDDEKALVDIEADPDTADERPQTTVAKWRLRDAVEALRGRGLEVSGSVGPEDPLDAIDSALDNGDHRTVVVVTDAAGIEGWVGLDLPSRVERRVSEPVITIEVD